MSAICVGTSSMSPCVRPLAGTGNGASSGVALGTARLAALAAGVAAVTGGRNGKGRKWSGQRPPRNLA